jgi:catechol 2,3-dioxygenase-like lactoylglutathione lyase family enzyme
MADNPGTPIVTKIIFPVDDLGRAAAFYRDLGFEVEAWDESYAWVSNGGSELLHLARADRFDPGANRAAGYLHVQDAAAWHRAWMGAGVEVTDLVEQPWGMREFSLRDPAGNLLRVGQNL